MLLVGGKYSNSQTNRVQDDCHTFQFKSYFYMKQMNFRPSTVACFVHDDRILAKLLHSVQPSKKIMKALLF